MAFRPVSKATIAFGEEFLYELKAGPAGGRLRRPSSAGSTAAEPSAQLTVAPRSADALTMNQIEPGSPEWCAAAMRSLVEAVRDLARSAAEQIALLEREHVDVDERALSYADVYQLVSQLHERGWITDHQRRLLDQINRLLSNLSDDRTDWRGWLWSDEALSIDPRWIEIRRSASEALVALQHE
jgi:hypothetical protein